MYFFILDFLQLCVVQRESGREGEGGSVVGRGREREREREQRVVFVDFF